MDRTNSGQFVLKVSSYGTPARQIHPQLNSPKKLRKMAAPQSSEICLSKNYVLQGKGLGCAHFDSLVNLFAVMRCFRSLVTHSPLLLNADEAS